MKQRQRRLRQNMAVLGVLAVCAEPQFALDLQRITGLSVGTLYPALARLEKASLVTSSWEPGGYPRRRRYSASLDTYRREHELRHPQ